MTPQLMSMVDAGRNGTGAVPYIIDFGKVGSRNRFGGGTVFQRSRHGNIAKTNYHFLFTCSIHKHQGKTAHQSQGVEKVDFLPERAEKDKSKATGKPVIEAYIRYVD